MKTFFTCAFALAAALRGWAESNIAPDHQFAWGANIGWTQWRADAITGVRVDEFVCAGFVYAANVGWINLGNGSPPNGVQYQNNTPNDFGVNVDLQGNLRGLAYGANIGWMNFESTGSPKVDLQSGKLSGYVYGANVGWISLSDASFFLQVSSIGPGTDSDQDGIPDAWELTHAGNLTTFDATSDSDHDGQTDLQEYFADTNPLDASDNLRILQLSVSPDLRSTTLAWTSRPTRHYSVQSRSDFDSTANWTDTSPDLEAAEGGVTFLTITNSLGFPQRFFRVRAIRPLSP